MRKAADILKKSGLGITKPATLARPQQSLFLPVGAAEVNSPRPRPDKCPKCRLGLIDGVMGAYCDECALGRDLRRAEAPKPPQPGSADARKAEKGRGAQLVFKGKPAPPQKELSPQVQHLLDAAEMIRSNWPGRDELAFLAKHLVQVTLPHSDPGNVEVWSRTNGNVTLSIVRIQRDPNTNGLIGYPYGTIPRLLLYWLTSEAVRTKSRTVKLGNTLSQFMKEVGLSPETGGGKRGDAVRLRDQMNRLFASSISFQYFEQGVPMVDWLNMPVTRRAQLWWNPKDPHQGDLFESWIELGEDFFNAITASPVPLDTRVLKALNHSAMALDLYTWATYKAHCLTLTKTSQYVSYSDLQGQLGAEYNDIKNFKKKLHIAFKQVQAVYPGLKSTKARGGLILHPSRPSVPYTTGASPKVLRS